MSRALAKLGSRTGVLVVALAFLALELGLTHRGGRARDVPTWGDERLGWVKAPGRVGRDAQGVEFRSNDLGYRDRDWARPAAPERSVLEGGRRGLRIAVLGDSMHYGPAIEEGALWPRRLEESLREELGPDVLVMNFAVVGYVFEQCARVWEDQVRAWRPDVVVLGVNSGFARPMRYLHRPRRGYLGDLVESSATYEWLQSLALEERAPWPVSWEAAPEGEEREAAAIELSLRRTPLAPENERIWRALLERLGGLAEDVRGHEGELLLLAVPRLEQTRGDLHRWLGDEWASTARHTGAGFLDLLEPFQSGMRPVLDEARRGAGIDVYWNANSTRSPQELERHAQSYFLYSDPEHLSELGHERVAELVLARLQESGYLSP